jgi:hypothetical protein
MSASEPRITPDSLRAMIQTASEDFDRLTQDRLAIGAKEYGEFAFIEAPTLAMALEELADLSNYARMTYIKISMLMKTLDQSSNEGFIATGSRGFTPTGGKAE